MAKSSLVKVAAVSAALLSIGAALAYSAVVQQGNLRIVVRTQVKPYKLPREGTAPIAVFVAGHLSAVNGQIPPQLKRLDVQVNRHGLLQSRGLPVCQIPRIQPATTQRALANCTDALIGSGQFWAHIVLPDQEPYPTRGRLLVFNGRKNGKPALLAHIFTSNPFASSFVVVFTIRKLRKGVYGTELSASLPDTLGDWGYVDRIKLTLKRKYRHRGKRLSYFNAGCPAPKGADSTSFPLARAIFSLARAKQVAATVTKVCGVRR